MSPTICRLLCVEDNDETCLMLRMLLGTRGYEVRTVGSVSGALSIAGIEDFDLFILDVLYPDGSGFDLCRQLRQIRPDTPVIFYSGVAYQSDIERGLGAGAEAYVVKPAIAGFVETVQRVVGEKCQTARV